MNRGVFKKDNRWYAQISKNGVIQHLGIFPTREQARVAWRTAKANFGPEKKEPLVKKLVPKAKPYIRPDDQRSPSLQSLDDITDDLASIGIHPEKLYEE